MFDSRQLKFSQRLKISQSAAWNFFRDPHNLPHITPPSLGFEILSDVGADIRAGMTIRYSVRAIASLRSGWLTEITHVEAPNIFVDQQLSGPYKVWHHQHIFVAVSGGTEVKDIIDYQLPFSPFSDFFVGGFVAKKLQAIFEYRRKVLSERFGEIE